MGTLVRGRTLNQRLRDLREATPAACGGFLATQTTAGVMFHQHTFSVGLEPPDGASDDVVAAYEAANNTNVVIGSGARAPVPPARHWDDGKLYVMSARTASMFRGQAISSQILVGGGGNARNGPDAVTVEAADPELVRSATPSSTHRGVVATRYPSADGAQVLRDSGAAQLYAGQGMQRRCGPMGTSIGLNQPRRLQIGICLAITDIYDVTTYLVVDPGTTAVVTVSALNPDDIFTIQILACTYFGDHFAMLPSMAGGSTPVATPIVVDSNVTWSFGDTGNSVVPTTTTVLVTPGADPADPSTWFPVLLSPQVLGPYSADITGASQISFGVDSADWLKPVH